MAKGRDDGELVAAATSGDSAAFGRLFDRWFDRVGDVAWRIVRNRDTAAEVAQAGFVAAWQQLDQQPSSDDFGPWLLRLARSQALDRLEHDRRPAAPGLTLDRREQRRGAGSAGSVAADSPAGVGGERGEGGDGDQIVWAAFVALGERDASLVDLHLRHRVTAEALAGELGVPASEAGLALEHQRSRLAVALRAWGLWSAGGDRCSGLTEALAAGGATHFGEAVRAIASHAAGCTTCSEAQQELPDPEAQFAAVPLAVAPVAMRAQAAAGLQAAGVEVGTAFTRSKPTGEIDRVVVPEPGGDPPSPPAPAPAEPAAAASISARSTRAERLAARGALVRGLVPAAGSPEMGRSPLDEIRGGGAYRPAGSGAGDVTAASPAPEPGQGPPLPPPSPAAAARAAGDRRRRLLLALAAAVVLLAGLTGAVLSAGGSGEDDHRVDSGFSRADDAGAFAGSDAEGDGDGSTADDRSDESSDGGEQDEATTSVPGASGGTLPGGETIPPGGGGTPGAPTGTTVPGGSNDPGTPPATSTTSEPGGPPSETTTTVATTAPPAGPPEITSFRATNQGQCGLLNLLRSVTFTWRSTGADSATFGPQSGTKTAVDPNGSASRCVAVGTVFQLTVTGPGGSDSATATVG